MGISSKKSCPRCGFRIDRVLAVCPNCQLNFNKFNQATNREAKIAIKEKRKEDCVMRSGFPSDIKKSRLLILTIFLGFLGAHNYYVGRYKRGIVFSIFFVVGVINTILSLTIPNYLMGSDLAQVFYLLVLGWGVVLILWLVDIFNIIFNKFKIPVSRNI